MIYTANTHKIDVGVKQKQQLVYGTRGICGGGHVARRLSSVHARFQFSMAHKDE